MKEIKVEKEEKQFRTKYFQALEKYTKAVNIKKSIADKEKQIDKLVSEATLLLEENMESCESPGELLKLIQEMGLPYTEEQIAKVIRMGGVGVLFQAIMIGSQKNLQELAIPMREYRILD